MALGIGVLMGISMGDSTLVFNQIAVIEELEGRIENYRQKNEEIVFHMDELRHELERWDILKERYLQPLFTDSLSDFSVTLIAGVDYPAELIEFLEESGCSYRAFYLAAPEQWELDPRVNTTLRRGESEVEKMTAFSYGEILWDAIQHHEERERDELLVILKDNGLLEVKRFSAKATYTLDGEAVKNQNDIFLLTGDIPFVTSVLRQGMGQRESDYSWIAINTGIGEEGGKGHQLPGNWTKINNGDTFFSRVELWEILMQLSAQSIKERLGG